MLLQHRVSEQAQLRPESTALVWKNQRLTYGELEETSNRLASLLVDARCDAGERVGVLMAKTPMAIVAMLGALKAGAAYVPLDPADHALRLAQTLATADCRWILVDAAGEAKLGEALQTVNLLREPLIGWLAEESLPAATAARMIFELRDLAAFSATPPDIDTPELAQILFASAWNGVPRGVMVTHASVAHSLDWAQSYFALTRDDRISQHAPLRCALAGFDIFSALWAGAELHLVPPELNLTPHKLVQFMHDAQLTQWCSVPAVLNLMAKFDAIGRHDCPALRRLLFAGEVMPTPTLMYLMRRLPQTRFTNLYGPAETTIASSYYTVPQCPHSEREPIPIGVACAGEELRVLDEQLQPVAAGEVGDLYIAGADLSPGYWRDLRHTNAVFIDDPYSQPGPPSPGGSGRRIYKTGDRARCDSNGLLYYCGRANPQIKGRAQRIDLGEVEAALNTLPELLETAVVAIPSAATGVEGALICCAYALAPGMEFKLERLRVRLAERLPAHMLPAVWMRYDVLPKTVHGKLDRQLLVKTFRRAGMTTRRGRAQEHPTTLSTPAALAG